MTFEELQRANELTKPTDIGKNKDYVEVNQRIKAFRMLYPNGSIQTELISLDNGVCIMRATVRDDAENILGTGTAYEKEGSSFINKTSYIENCETSAVGRALAMLGIGVDVSIASKEEVENAKVQQAQEELVVNEENKDNLVDKTDVVNIKREAMRTGTPVAKLFGIYKIHKLEEMTKVQYQACITKLKALPDKEEKK